MKNPLLITHKKIKWNIQYLCAFFNYPKSANLYFKRFMSIRRF